MEEVKKYSDMTYIEFIKDVLKVELTAEQEVLVKLFEENKGKKIEYVNTNIPFFNREALGSGNRPITTYVDECHSSCLDNVRIIK